MDSPVTGNKRAREIFFKVRDDERPKKVIVFTDEKTDAPTPMRANLSIQLSAVVK